MLAAVVRTVLAPGLTRFGTRVFLSLSPLSSLPPLIEMNSKALTAMRNQAWNLFKKQFSLNSGEDMERAFH